MANIISTVMTYPLNGSTVDFVIPFEYLARKFVKVTLVGTNRKELVINQDYRFTTRTQVTTTRAWGPSDSYEFIEIRRYTSATDRLVDFADGSILRAYDLNISQVQTLHVAEEARDLTADTIGVNNDGNLDARGRRIVNVADGIDAGDVVTVRQQQAWADSALNQADRAKTEADRAKTEADRVTSQATISSSAAAAALVSEGKAKTSEDNAKASETAAGVSASSATGSAAAALVSEGKAKTSEDNAKASELRAITEANKLGNMNDLAAAIESVDPVTHKITFKGQLNLKAAGVADMDAVTVKQLNDTVTPIGARVTTLENHHKFTIDYRNGTEQNPATISVSANVAWYSPWPNRIIACRAEVFYLGEWGEAGFASNAGSGSSSFGVKAFVRDKNILLWTGSTSLLTTSSVTGGAWYVPEGTHITTLPFRILIWTID